MEGNNLLQKLKDWRRNEAQKEGADLFRVLPNVTLEIIVERKKGHFTTDDGVEKLESALSAILEL